MTDLAVVLQQWQYIFVEGRRRGRAIGSRGGDGCLRQGNKNAQCGEC